MNIRSLTGARDPSLDFAFAKPTNKLDKSDADALTKGSVSRDSTPTANSSTYAGNPAITPNAPTYTGPGYATDPAIGGGQSDLRLIKPKDHTLPGLKQPTSDVSFGSSTLDELKKAMDARNSNRAHYLHSKIAPYQTTTPEGDLGGTMISAAA